MNTCLGFITLISLTIAHGAINNIKNSNALTQPKSTLLDGYAKFPVPYQVSVQGVKGLGHEHLCAGTIIDEEVVLTAAHCFYRNQQPEDLSIVGGSNTLSTVEGVRHRVTAMNLHEYYDPLMGRDIALLRVQPKFVLDGLHYAKIDFNATRDKDLEQRGYLIGWGRTKPGKVQQLELISFRTLHTRKCWNRGYVYVTSTDMCAISDKGRGACDGDSGGPLVNTDFNLQLGILSYGREACQRGQIYVFTALHPLRRWIVEHMASLKKQPKSWFNRA